eukprot:scaffold38005_cov153-Amphora_coffeaeformis.AAC.2
MGGMASCSSFGGPLPRRYPTNGKGTGWWEYSEQKRHDCREGELSHDSHTRGAPRHPPHQLTMVLYLMEERGSPICDTPLGSCSTNVNSTN